MNKRRSVVFFGILLSCLFSLIYAGIFMMIEPKVKNMKVSFNQVGIYQKIENAQATSNTLKELGLEPLIYEREGLQVVVCSMSEDRKITENEQTILDEANISYILKEFELKSNEAIDAMKQKEFQQVLEMMMNQS